MLHIMSFSSTRLCSWPKLCRLVKLSRAIYSSPGSSASTISPESPSYIRVPTPSQSDETKPARLRGSLPIPRNIFPRAQGNRKVQPGYVQRTAPEPAKRPQKLTSSQKWRAELADTRRMNLKQGLQSLWARRLRSDRDERLRQAHESEGRCRALADSEREDDRLTRGTVMKALLDTKVYPDPQRFARARRSRRKVAAVEDSKRRSRRDALTLLYISASSFIIDETELKAKLDEIFSDNCFMKASLSQFRHSGVDNIWGQLGPPPSISAMLAISAGKPAPHSTDRDSVKDAHFQRQIMVAEELIGAKLP